MAVLSSQSDPLQNPVCLKGVLIQCTKKDSKIFSAGSQSLPFLFSPFVFNVLRGGGHACMSATACMWRSGKCQGLGSLSMLWVLEI